MPSSHELQPWGEEHSTPLMSHHTSPKPMTGRKTTLFAQIRPFICQNTVYATLLVCICTLIGSVLLAKLGRVEEYGIATVESASSSRQLQIKILLCYQLPLSILTGLVAMASDHVQLYLWSADTRGGAFAASILLWIVLMLSSLPFPLFGNSVFFLAKPAHDAYEILVSESYLAGELFDLAQLKMTEFKDQVAAPQPFGTPWPNEWPGGADLQDLLQSVQNDASKWTNMSNQDCRTNYGTQQYSDFRSVLLVTNWTSSLPANNSALAIGALPGYITGGLADRLMAVCPEAYLATTPASFTPDNTPYLGVADLHECKVATGQSPIPCEDRTTAKAMSKDMCYSYRSHGAATWNQSEALTLSYCLSEPSPPTPSLIVYNQSVVIVLLVATAIKGFAMAIACWINWGPHYEHERFRDDRLSDLFKSAPWIVYHALLLPEYVMWLVIYYSGLEKFGEGISPPQQSGGGWIFGIAAYVNMLQVVYRLQAFCVSIWGWSRPKQSKFITIPSGVVFFLYGLAMQLVAAAFINIVMIQRYPLSTLKEAGTFQPIVFLDTLFDSNMSMKPLSGDTRKSWLWWAIVGLFFAARFMVTIIVYWKAGLLDS